MECEIFFDSGAVDARRAAGPPRSIHGGSNLQSGGGWEGIASGGDPLFYAVMLLCDHTLRPLAGPKHWPQDGAPGGMRWGMSQDRVAAPKTRCYRPRERS